ncbi:MAG: ribosome biogenesis GTP-binding protein YihA/YsxC [Longimicrobiales bacterium]
MKLLDVEFAGALASPRGRVPGDLAQVAFAGRSNVGKSSLINRVLARTRTPIARVSATPGKTQEINFYRVNAQLASGHPAPFYLVDLPGYGYARAPDAVRARWGPLIENYLADATALRGVILLLDMRHEPTALDLQMFEYLGQLGIPVLFVLTKADKLKANAAEKREADLRKALGLPVEQVIAFSAKTGAGREALLDALDALLTEERP